MRKSSSIMSMAKCVVTGMVIGGTVGITVASSMKKPTARDFRRKTARAIDTMGSVMRSVADYVG